MNERKSRNGKDQTTPDTLKNVKPDDLAEGELETVEEALKQKESHPRPKKG
jgi:hypothetical protein